MASPPPPPTAPTTKNNNNNTNSNTNGDSTRGVATTMTSPPPLTSKNSNRQQKKHQHQQKQQQKQQTTKGKFKRPSAFGIAHDRDEVDYCRVCAYYFYRRVLRLCQVSGGALYSLAPWQRLSTCGEPPGVSRGRPCDGMLATGLAMAHLLGNGALLVAGLAMARLLKDGGRWPGNGPSPGRRW